MSGKFCNNKVIVSGKVIEEAKYNHNVQEKEFFQFYISSQRTSGTEDRLPVIIDKNQLEQINLKLGQRVCVKGELRSYNDYSNKKLLIYVFAKNIELCEHEDVNTISFEGYICRRGDVRITTLSKKKVLDVMLAINKSNSRSSYIPSIIWGLDKEHDNKILIGDKLSILGRIQSREYDKVLENGDVETRTAYEVSVINYTKCE